MDSRVCVHRSLVLRVLILSIYDVINIHLINENPHVNVVKILRYCFEKYNELTDSYIYCILSI